MLSSVVGLFGLDREALVFFAGRHGLGHCCIRSDGKLATVRVIDSARLAAWLTIMTVAEVTAQTPRRCE